MTEPDWFNEFQRRQKRHERRRRIVVKVLEVLQRGIADPGHAAFVARLGKAGGA